MKMNLFDKFLLALVLILLLALSFLLGAVALSLLPLGAVSEFFDRLLPMWQINAWIFGGIALVLFALTVRLLAASYGAGNKQAYTRLALNENGEVAISIATIKQIVASFMATRADVTSSSSVIVPGKVGLSVRLRLCVKEGTLLPDLTTSLQKDLKAHLETITGLTICQIGVLVDTNKPNASGKAY